MTWGHQREHTCCDCQRTFLSAANNVDRCPECRRKHNNAIHARRMRNRRKAEANDPNKPHVCNDTARFNMMIQAAARNARCPRCKKKMRKCRCIDAPLRVYQPPVVATFRPWAMPLPKMKSIR